jgi:beta-N-acetylhexosaminidase
VFIIVSVGAAYLAMTSPTPPPSVPLPTYPQYEPTYPGYTPPETEPTPDEVTPTPAEPTPDEALIRAQEILSGMTTDEKIWQLFIVTPEQLTGYKAVTEAGNATKAAITDRPVGGVIYSATNIEKPTQVTTMLTKIQGYSKLPLLLAVSEEGGGAGPVSGKSAMSFPSVGTEASIGASGDPSVAGSAGQIIGGALAGLGFNLDLSPVADLDLGGSVLGERVFGSEPTLVSRMTESFIDGLRGKGIAAAVKYFPGMGGATVDPNDNYSESSRAFSDMENAELMAFRAAVDAGAQYIVMSNLAYPTLDPSGRPASLSEPIIKLLRDNLGFRGVVITDSLSAGAITRKFAAADASVFAIEAGADMLLMPEDLAKAFAAIKDAVASGRISEARLDESVTRILIAKSQLTIDN